MFFPSKLFVQNHKMLNSFFCRCITNFSNLWFISFLVFQTEDEPEGKFNIFQDILILEHLRQLNSPDEMNYQTILDLINLDIRQSAHPMPPKNSKYVIRDRIRYYLVIYDQLGAKKPAQLPNEERRKLEQDLSELEYPFYDE